MLETFTMHVKLEETIKKMDSLIIGLLNLFAHDSNCFSLQLFSQQVL